MTLTPAEEGRLFRRDYLAWCNYAAPRWIATLLRDAEGINKHWPIASEPLRAAIWRAADDATKARIRNTRAGAPSPGRAQTSMF